MPLIRHEKNDIILDFKLFRFRINTKKNYIVSNNKILLIDAENGTSKEVESYSGLNVIFKDNDSIVSIYKGTKFVRCNITVRKNCHVTIGASKYEIKGLNIQCADNSEIVIGKNFSSFGTAIFSDNELNKKVIIGEDCMFSSGISIRNSDGHRIYDITTKEVLNNGENVVIGNHVWVGPGVRILKGVEIADNTIIGAASFVNKKCSEENVILAGVPAKIVKSGINWDRKPPGSEIPIEEYIKEKELI